MIYNCFYTHQIKSLMLDSGYMKKKKKTKNTNKQINECDLLEFEHFTTILSKEPNRFSFFLSFRFGQERN